MEVRTIVKLDYSLNTPEERNEFVQQVIKEHPEELNEKYLEVLADYLILCMEKQEKKEKKILTDNRLVTVNQRETSFEGLVSQLENGEDGVYNLITEDKNTIFRPKVTITKKDIEEIPYLAQLREAIELWEAQLKVSEGKKAYILKKALIEMRKDQYLIKAAFRKPVTPNKLCRSQAPRNLDLDLKNPDVVSAILCNYSRLKEDSWDRFSDDTWYLMLDFDDLCGRALAEYPLYERLVEYKIDGLTNLQIQSLLEQEFAVCHSVEYLSSLWRNKIPKLIASQAEDDELNWYYLTQEKGKYKKCNRCGEIKLAHPKYFSKNKTSKDQLYSICKKCRSVKK